MVPNNAPVAVCLGVFIAIMGDLGKVDMWRGSLLFVTLDREILDGWVYAVGVTRGGSVPKSTGLGT